jgi:hypothetical protein
MVEEADAQRTPGLTQPCCTCLTWGVRCGYIKKGFLWWQEAKRVWIPWCLRLSGIGWIETSPIHFCPFCGVNLDKPEE